MRNNQNSSELPITTSEELVDVLRKGFDETEMHTTKSSDPEKHQVVLIVQEPICGDKEVDSLKVDQLNFAHCFEFTKNNCTSKASTLHQVGSSQDTSKLTKKKKFERNPRLAYVISKDTYYKEITKNAKEKAQGYLGLCANSFVRSKSKKDHFCFFKFLTVIFS